MLESAGVKPSEVVLSKTAALENPTQPFWVVSGCVHDQVPLRLEAKKEGFHLLFRPADTEYGLFPTAVIGAENRG